MKRLLLILLLFSSPLFAKDLGMDITLATSPVNNGVVNARAKQVTFIFSSDFVGTIRGACFSGVAGTCATGSPIDFTLTIKAPAGDTYLSIDYIITSGSMKIVRIQ